MLYKHHRTRNRTKIFPHQLFLGSNVGPSITGMFRVLGREKVLQRLERFFATV